MNIQIDFRSLCFLSIVGVPCDHLSVASLTNLETLIVNTHRPLVNPPRSSFIAELAHLTSLKVLSVAACDPALVPNPIQVISLAKVLPHLRLLHLDAANLQHDLIIPILKSISPPGPTFVLKNVPSVILTSLMREFPKLSFAAELPYELPVVFETQEKRIRFL